MVSVLWMQSFFLVRVEKPALVLLFLERSGVVLLEGLVQVSDKYDKWWWWWGGRGGGKPSR